MLGITECRGALIPAESFEVPPFECRWQARGGPAGLDQIACPRQIAFLPRLEGQLHVGELTLLCLVGLGGFSLPLLFYSDSTLLGFTQEGPSGERQTGD